ncbi:hypothetical protein vseg_018024 [Gypsophila vaccaria]
MLGCNCLLKSWRTRSREAVAFSGGFGSYLLGLNKKTYEQAWVDTKGNVYGSYKEPRIGWMTGFLFVSSFVGLLKGVCKKGRSSLLSTMAKKIKSDVVD